MASQPSLLGPPRKYRRRTEIRYWSRSKAVSMLVEFGEAAQLGGETLLREMDLKALERVMRKSGFKQFALHEDGYPNNFPPHYIYK